LVPGPFGDPEPQKLPVSDHVTLDVSLTVTLSI